MKGLIRNIGIFTGVFAVSFSAAFFSQYKTTKKATRTLTDETVTVTAPLTDKQKLLNSLLEIKAFDLDASLSIIGKDDTSIGIAIDGQGDLTDLEDIKIQGHVDAEINESHLKANLGYFGGEIFFDYNESYFKLETSQVLDFVSMLPTYGVNVSLPVEFEDMDLSMIESYIDQISEKQTTPDGQNYYFTLSLSDKIDLYLITDLDLNFTGVRTGSIAYNDMIIKLDAKLNRLSSVDLVNPKDTVAEYAKYQDFAPAFKLFDGIYALTQKKQNTINVDATVNEVSESETKRILKTNLDIIYDIESEKHTFGLDGDIYALKNKKDGTSEEVVTPYSFALYDKCIYAHYGDVAFKVETNNLTELLQFVINKIGDDKITDMINGLTSTMSTSQVADIVSKANDLFGTIVLTGDELDINLNTSNFSTTFIDEESGEEKPKLTLSDLTIAIKFDSNTGALETISINNFAINSYVADVVLTFGDYRPFELDAVNYQSVDHLFGLAYAIDQYSQMNKFRIEFDGKISKEDEVIDGATVSYNDIDIDGGLQFELDPLREEEGHINIGYGYGDLSITDRKDVKHNIKVDMKDVNEVLLAYSTVTGTSRDAEVDPMKVKMKVQTMKDLVDVISELMKNPDDHYNELIGSMLDETAELPIKDIIAGDYLQLLATNLIDRFEVGPDYVEFDIALDILALEGESFTVRIEFSTYKGCADGIKALKISNFSYSGLSINFNAYLKDFNPNLESTRLPSSEVTDYIDFSDLKVLLQLGINTSKNNYYHFTATANVGISLFSINLDVPLDIRVWTDHGDVKVDIWLTDIPVVFGINVPIDRSLTTSNRSAHIYYHDGLFYINRTETYTSGILVWKTTHKVEHVAKYDLDTLFDNVLDILCGDILCLNDTFLNMINDAVNKNKDESYKMKYENILNDFLYVPEGHYFHFDINLSEIANNKQLSSFTLKVLTDNTDTNLAGLNAKLTIDLTSLLSLVIKLDLELADCSLVADASNNIDNLDAFETRMSGYAVGYKTTTDTTL